MAEEGASAAAAASDEPPAAPEAAPACAATVSEAVEVLLRIQRERMDTYRDFRRSAGRPAALRRACCGVRAAL